MDIEPVTKWLLWNPPAAMCKITGGSPNVVIPYSPDIKVHPPYVVQHKPGFWEHNHIEHGHVDNEAPIVKFPVQEWWNKATWLRIHTYVIDGKLI